MKVSIGYFQLFIGAYVLKLLYTKWFFLKSAPTLQVLAERSSSWPTGRQVAVMSPGAALRPSLAVEGEVAWLTDPGDMSVMTCRHRIIGERASSLDVLK